MCLFITKEEIMEKQKINITSNIIAVIISLMTIVTVFSGFISNQAVCAYL